MHADLFVKEPLEKVIDDWDFFEDRVVGRFSTFLPVGQNIYGIRKRDIDATQVVDPRKGAISAHYELGPSGLSTWSHGALKMHITAAGTPHHVAHNFGYWHINDMDELYLPLPAPAPGAQSFFVVCMGNPGPGDGDNYAWYCEKCLTLLYEYRYETGSLGFNGFWRAERVAVNGYNAHAKNQLCPECGHVNPKGYCWNTAKDNEQERSARQQW
jgi:hypothetical protein